MSEHFMNKFKDDIQTDAEHFAPAKANRPFGCPYCKTQYGINAVRFYNNWKIPKPVPICAACVQKYELNTANGEEIPHKPPQPELQQAKREYDTIIAYLQKLERVFNTQLDDIRLQLTQIATVQKLGGKKPDEYKGEQNLPDFLLKTDDSIHPGTLARMHREGNKAMTSIKDVAGGLVDKFRSENND